MRLAEVVRNLAIREAEKGLSTGEEADVTTRAKKILASEDDVRPGYGRAGGVEEHL